MNKLVSLIDNLFFDIECVFDQYYPQITNVVSNMSEEDFTEEFEKEMHEVYNRRLGELQSRYPTIFSEDEDV